MADPDPGTPVPADRAQPRVRKERAIASKTIAALAVAFLLIAFALSNDDSVRVDYLVTTNDSPLIVVIAVSAVLGALLGALTVWRRSR
jgi:uncharacterized integral membrane protein